MRMSSVRSGYTKSKWYAGNKLEADHDNVFSCCDEAKHAEKRSKMALGYGGKEVPNLEAKIDSHVLDFINLIRRKYLTVGSKITPIDLAEKASYFTMDVITDLAFSQTWGCLEQDRDVDDWFRSMELFLPLAARASAIPFLASLFGIPFISRLIMPSDKDEAGPGRLLRVTKDVVNARFASPDKDEEQDMLASFIRHSVPQSEAVAEGTTQIIAGGDTTATTLRATMLFIITNPHVYKKLQAEIDSTVREGPVISDAQARTLPYLQAVIKEGARMFPAATGMMSKVVPPEGDTINGIFIPGGTDIGKNDWAIQRDKNVYGEDSTFFRPERWLEARDEQLEKMERTVGLVWGYGKYSCLGKNIALMELNKAYFELLRHFDFTLIDPEKPWFSLNYTLWFQKDMWVRVTERT